MGQSPRTGNPSSPDSILHFLLEVESLPNDWSGILPVPFWYNGGIIYLFEVPLLCHWQLLLLLHRPLYSLPLQCLKAASKVIWLESDWGCNASLVSWAVLAEGKWSFAYWDWIFVGLVHTNTDVCNGTFRDSELHYQTRAGILNLDAPCFEWGGRAAAQTNK